MLTAGDGAAGQLGDGAAGSSGGVKSHLTSCGRRADVSMRCQILPGCHGSLVVRSTPHFMGNWHQRSTCCCSRTCRHDGRWKPLRANIRRKCEWQASGKARVTSPMLSECCQTLVHAPPDGRSLCSLTCSRLAAEPLRAHGALRRFQLPPIKRYLSSTHTP